MGINQPMMQHNEPLTSSSGLARAFKSFFDCYDPGWTHWSSKHSLGHEFFHLDKHTYCEAHLSTNTQVYTFDHGGMPSTTLPNGSITSLPSCLIDSPFREIQFCIISAGAIRKRAAPQNGTSLDLSNYRPINQNPIIFGIRETIAK